MDLLIISPIMIPLTTAALAILASKKQTLQILISVVGAFCLLLSSLFLLHHIWDEGILVAYVGNWTAPFGITLVADYFSVIMVILTGLMGFAVALYSIVDVDEKKVQSSFIPLFHFLLMGCCGSFLTGDIFNLYVWFEVMLMSSFTLMALGGKKDQLKGTIKYLILNLVGSMLFLVGIGLVYGLTGTLNMADLAIKFQSINGSTATALSYFFLLAFGMKAAVFPLFFWLPASYHTPSVSVSAIFAGLLTKVGVYTLIRVFTLIFWQGAPATYEIILVISGLTMVVGVFGAVAQWDFRRLLSFHIISQIGYMIMGLGLATKAGVAAAIFYIMHHIIVKTNLFLASGVVHRIQGKFQLKQLGGLYKSHPLLCVCFLVPALSLAGVPPLSGFWAKFILIKESFGLERFFISFVALSVGFLTFFSMIKIWTEAFWKPLPENEKQKELTGKEKTFFYLPMVLLAVCTIMVGVFLEPLNQLSYRASEQLVNPTQYIQSVLYADKSLESLRDV